MKRLIQVGLMGAGAMGLVWGSLVVAAGSWDNFKLQYGAWTQLVMAQAQDLADGQQRLANAGEATRIDVEQLLSGGPPKDGIPSIDAPQFDTVNTTPFDANAEVIGVEINGEAVAYPIGILNWHEIVNDTIGGVNVSVTYCPLCDTAIVFERGDTTFGVSGQLYQSCLVMYDRSDDSLYAQPWGIGVMGPQVNQTLARVPAVKTTLAAWLRQHPETQILSTDTGHSRNYFRYPYGTYSRDRAIIFPVRNQDALEHHPKTAITYVWEADGSMPHNQFSGDHHQFINAQVRRRGEQRTELNGRPIRAYWDETLETVIVEEENGERLPSSPAFAFVYPAFFQTQTAASGE